MQPMRPLEIVVSYALGMNPFTTPLTTPLAPLVFAPLTTELEFWLSWEPTEVFVEVESESDWSLDTIALLSGVVVTVVDASDGWLLLFVLFLALSFSLFVTLTDVADGRGPVR